MKMHELTPGAFYDLSHVMSVSIYERDGCLSSDNSHIVPFYDVKITATYGQIHHQVFPEKHQAEARLKELLQMIKEAKR